LIMSVTCGNATQTVLLTDAAGPLSSRDP
jgi:hypothetical protein